MRQIRLVRATSCEEDAPEPVQASRRRLAYARGVCRPKQSNRRGAGFTVLTCRSRGPFQIVRPWSTDSQRQDAVISEHPTPADAFREIERLASEIQGTGDASGAVELIVVDADGRLVPRSAVE